MDPAGLNLPLRRPYTSKTLFSLPKATLVMALVTVVQHSRKSSKFWLFRDATLYIATRTCVFPHSDTCAVLQSLVMVWPLLPAESYTYLAEVYLP